MSFDQITIIGVGLIGGSVGLAAKARGVARHVVGVDRNTETLKKAETLGAIDAGTTDLAEGVRDANLVVVCTPVDTIADVILAAAPDARPGTLFTDAGSTKAAIVKAVERRICHGVHFVGSHPLAGAEKNSVEHARADLFEKRPVILTPTPLTDESACFTVADFWIALGSRTVQIPPDDHDEYLAFTSHLPHAVASAVAGVTSPDLLTLTAGGFRDVTRIAGGDPKLWAAIFEANRECVLAALSAFTDRLNEFRTQLEAGDRAGIERWLAEGKQVRDALGT